MGPTPPPWTVDNLTAMSSSRPFKVGVMIHPQQCTIQELRDAWRRVDDLGVDSIWFWDHFFPLYGNPNGNHFECWSLLAAAVIDEWCRKVGRDPREIERTANVVGLSPKAVDEWLQAGLQHFVLRIAHPFDTKEVARLLKVRDS